MFYKKTYWKIYKESSEKNGWLNTIKLHFWNLNISFYQVNWKAKWYYNYKNNAKKKNFNRTLNKSNGFMLINLDK